jgi:hypothetical protein
MNNWVSFLFPSILGLLAGIGHGISSHYQDLPFSLADQVIEVVQESSSFN